MCFWQLVFALRHRLIPQRQEEQEEEDAKRVSDGHRRSFGSGPWQKQFIVISHYDFFVIIFFFLHYFESPQPPPQKILCMTKNEQKVQMANRKWAFS